MSDPGTRPQRRRRDAALRVVLALMCLAGIGLVARSGQVLANGRHLPPQYSVAPQNGVAAQNSVAASASAAVGRTASGAPASARGPSASTVPAAEPGQTAVSAFVPTYVRIPDLQVSAPTVGVTTDAGALIPPEQPSTVGWWLGGALAGADTGTTVVVGHIDSATRGLGAFYHLDQVKAGDTIQLVSGHTTAAYRVVSLHFYVKAAGLPQSLFTRTGPARLAVISCGGSFDRAKRSYRENVVVIAEPVTR